MTLSSEAIELLGQRVRVLSGADPTHVMGEGEIIAYCDAPTITVRADDGTLTHHSTELPREPVAPMWHAEVTTAVGWDDDAQGFRGDATVGFAEHSLAALVDKIEREHPHNYGFAIWRDDCGFIYPSSLYQRFVKP